MTHALPPSVAVLAGGVGAARFLRALFDVVDQRGVTAIVNTADDTVFHGLHVSPDIDTVVYSTAGAIDPERGWGLAGESWRAMEAIGRYASVGATTWFNLGDQDLATHLWRTDQLRKGRLLHEVTADLARSWGLSANIIPVTNDPLATFVQTVDGELAFQEYFVRRRHDVAVSSVRFAGIEKAQVAPGVLEALDAADVIVIAPSNPIVSIGPILGVAGIREALTDRRKQVVAISPIIAGAALKGPADRMMTELGFDASVVGVARLYRDIAATLVVDTADESLRSAVFDAGMHCVVTETVMSKPGVGASLVRAVMNSVVQPGM